MTTEQLKQAMWRMFGYGAKDYSSCAETEIKELEAKLSAQTAESEICTGCNGRGEVGGLTMEGYQSEPCPYCKTEQPVAEEPMQMASKLISTLLLEAEKFWWNDGPSGKSAINLCNAEAALYAHLRLCFAHPVQTEQPSLSDARILELAKKHSITIGGYTFESEVIAFARDLLAAQRQDSDKDVDK